MKMNVPNDVLYVIETIEKHGNEAVVVGGCVRDALLGKEPADFDVATNALPEQILAWFEHTVPTGLQHGTVTVLLDQHIEVTTYRTETRYSDHRHPDEVHFVSDLTQDLARRDFTVNAMAYHPKRGLIDPFDGQTDIKEGIIRCVGVPKQRFTEDALRLLRAHRFAARLGFQIEEKTRQAMQICEPLLEQIAVERIRHEVLLTLEADPYQLEQMTTLLKPWLPELETSLACDQNTPYHDTNVLHHTLRALTFLKPFDETLALALLVHDLGKPACHTHENGRDHFKGHPQVGKQIAKRLCREWKLTRAQRKWIPEYVRYHDSRIHQPEVFIHRFCIEKGWDDPQILDLLTIKRCDILAHSTLGQKTLADLEQLEQEYQKMKETRPLSLRDLAINGKDIQETFGKEGKEIKEALEACLEYAFYHPEENRKESLLEWIRKEFVWM